MSPTHRLFLCADMDRTVIPNGFQPEPAGARARLRSFCGLPGVTLAYVTGRDPGLVDAAIADYGLPRPDYVITDVGTRIHELGQGSWREIAAWQEQIAPHWRGRGAGELRELLNPVSELRLQEAGKQSRFKLSYYLPLGGEPAATLQRMETLLQGAGIEASIVWSIDELAGIGLVDVLPLRATKLEAIEFLQQQLGCGDDRTVFAGDSGNDLDVLASHIPAVLVGNASEEVRMEALRRADAAGSRERLFLAPAGAGNYSAGVLQGVAHYLPPWRPLLDQDAS